MQINCLSSDIRIIKIKWRKFVIMYAIVWRKIEKSKWIYGIKQLFIFKMLRRTKLTKKKIPKRNANKR